jgi:hypothetical protein
LPLWLIGQPDAVPRWSVGYAFAINTVIVVLGQRRHAAWMEARAERRRAGAGSGLMIAAAIGGYGALAEIHDHALGLIVLTLAVTVHSVGEIYQANAFGAATYDLSPPGQYGYLQAFYYATGGGLRAFSPLLMTYLALSRPPALWTALAAIFVLAGVVGAALIPEHQVAAERKEIPSARRLRPGRDRIVDPEIPSSA